MSTTPDVPRLIVPLRWPVTSGDRLSVRDKRRQTTDIRILRASKAGACSFKIFHFCQIVIIVWRMKLNLSWNRKTIRIITLLWRTLLSLVTRDRRYVQTEVANIQFPPKLFPFPWLSRAEGMRKSLININILVSHKKIQNTHTHTFTRRQPHIHVRAHTLCLKYGLKKSANAELQCVM